MQKIVIIDDEALSRSTIRSIITDFCPNAMVIGEAIGVKDGVNIIKTLNPDLILLDIKLEDGTGFDLLKEIHGFKGVVIFITAYEEFAIRAFKTSAIDYLIKPIDIEELKSAVSKSETLNEKNTFEAQLNILLANFHQKLGNQSLDAKKIVLKTSTEIHLLDQNEILYLSADGNYTKFHLTNKTSILTTKTLKEYEEILSEKYFIRIHQSSIVNMLYASKFDKRNGDLILKDKTVLSVSVRKKEVLIAYFESL